MVKEINIVKSGVNIKYEFSYNENNELSKFVISYGKPEKEFETDVVFTYDGKTIKRKDYSKKNSMTTFEYFLNENKHITKVIQIDYPYEGDELVRTISEYKYSYDPSKKLYYISQYKETEGMRYEGNKDFTDYKGNFIQNFSYENGYFYVDGWKNKYVNLQDENHINKTNVNFLQLITGSGRSNSEMISYIEWCPIRSDYFPKNNKVRTYEYQYDNNGDGNVVFIKEYFFGSLSKMIYIDYVY